MGKKTELNEAQWMARRLKAARAMLDLSQQELSDASGVSQDVINAVEGMRGEPELADWRRILNVLRSSGIVPTAVGLEFDTAVFEIPERARRLWSVQAINDPLFPK